MGNSYLFFKSEFWDESPRIKVPELDLCTRSESPRPKVANWVVRPRDKSPIELVRIGAKVLRSVAATNDLHFYKKWYVYLCGKLYIQPCIFMLKTVFLLTKRKRKFMARIGTLVGSFENRSFGMGHICIFHV